MEKLNNDDKAFATTPAQRKATRTYLEKNDLVELSRTRVSRADKAEYIKKVKALGYSSMAQFVLSAVDEKLEREYNK